MLGAHPASAGGGPGPTLLGWAGGSPSRVQKGVLGWEVRPFCDTFGNKAQCYLQLQVPTCAVSVLLVPEGLWRCLGLSLVSPPLG